MSGFLWVPVVVAVAALAVAAVVWAVVKVSDLFRARDARWVRSADVDRIAGERLMVMVRQLCEQARARRCSFEQAAAEELPR